MKTTLIIFSVLTLALIVSARFPQFGVIKWAKRGFSRAFPDLAEVLDYVFEKYLDGFAVGALFAVFSFLDRKGTFVKSVDELLTSLHPVIVILGFLSACCYLSIKWFYAQDMGLYRQAVFRVSKSWLDLVQQFFALAMGAFFPVKLAVITYEHGVANFWEDLEKMGGTLAAIIFCNILFAGMWILKDKVPGIQEGRTPSARYGQLFIVSAIIGAGLITVFFVDPTDGAANLNKLWLDITRIYAGLLS